MMREYKAIMDEKFAFIRIGYQLCLTVLADVLMVTKLSNANHVLALNFKFHVQENRWGNGKWVKFSIFQTNNFDMKIQEIGNGIIEKFDHEKFDEMHQFVLTD